MKWESLLEAVADKQVLSTVQLLSNESTGVVRFQLFRWVTEGRLVQLRRGFYALAPTVLEVSWHPFLIANHLQSGSYVSVQSALAFYSMIPDHAPIARDYGFFKMGNCKGIKGLWCARQDSNLRPFDS